jgi:molybdopterin-guanine dinucleotide biosynthesis protein A
MGTVTWAAVILTGGTATRLDGADKASLQIAGRSLLDIALAAVAGAAELVVVGPEAPVTASVRFVREEPPGGGPLAGVAAGVAGLSDDHDLVVVLAVDMPGVTAGTVERLLAAARDEDVDAAWLCDGDGRRQLAGAVRPDLVPGPEQAHGAAMRVLMTAGRSRDVPATGREADDVDTWDDLVRLRGDEPPGVASGQRT